MNRPLNLQTVTNFDSRVLSFEVPGDPIFESHQQKVPVTMKGKTRMVHPAKYTKALKTLISTFALIAPKEPLTGPLALEIKVVWPFRKSEKKKNREAGITLKDTKPDADNIAKLYGDALERAGFFKDDSQCADLTVRKRWGAEPKVEITIKQFEW